MKTPEHWADLVLNHWWKERSDETTLQDLIARAVREALADQATGESVGLYVLFMSDEGYADFPMQHYYGGFASLAAAQERFAQGKTPGADDSIVCHWGQVAQLTAVGLQLVAHKDFGMDRWLLAAEFAEWGIEPCR